MMASRDVEAERGVEVQRWVILDKGKRKPAGRYDRISMTGASGGIDAGMRLTPYVKLSGKSTFKRGKAKITVQSDGSFTWSRLVKKGKKMTAYVSYRDTKSNQIVWLRIR